MNSASRLARLRPMHRCRAVLVSRYMQNDLHGSCLPRTVALYIAVYAAGTLMPSVYRWSHAAWRIGMPPPFGVSDAAVLAQELILLVWLPLSYFVWQRRSWAMRLVAYSSLLLGTAQTVQYHWMFRSQPLHEWLHLVSGAMILAVPTFFLSAVAFYAETRISSRADDDRTRSS